MCSSWTFQCLPDRLINFRFPCHTDPSERIFKNKLAFYALVC